MASVRTQQILVVTMSTLAFTVCFAIWMMFGVIGIPIKTQLGLNETQFGVLIATPVLTGSLIRLPLGKVSSVTHLKYTDANGALQTLSASTDYQTDLYSQPARIMPAYGASWPTVRADTFNVVTARFVAGYGSAATDVPGPIREAILLAVGHWMNFQPGVEGAVSITRLPYAVLDLLAPYRLHAFG